MSNKPIVLVTGISGFVGSHVVTELVKNGYAVRGTVRSAKRETLQSTVCKTYPDISLVPLEDVATGDLSDALKGVQAVIHIASPLPGKDGNETILQSAIEGTLNVMRQAEAAGVNKFVLTGSWGATLHPSLKEAYMGIRFDAHSWGNVTYEEASKNPSPMFAYLSSKILAERAAWQFAEEHPKFDLATINPPFIYGPFPSGFPTPPNPTGLGSNRMIYQLLNGEPGRSLPMQVPPFFCDVRDVAKAHVAALKVDTSSLGRNKRYMICGGSFTWKDATEYITKAFPQLKPHLPSTENAPALPGVLSTIDTRPAAEELGMNEYLGWEVTIHDTISSFLDAEGSWTSKKEIGTVTRL